MNLYTSLSKSKITKVILSSDRRTTDGCLILILTILTVFLHTIIFTYTWCLQKNDLLRILDTEANKFYDRNHQLYDAELLTRCYTQHALRPFIDSEINHKRHFIKIPFINKGIEFIDLPSIFKDRSVTSSIPAYFQNSEPPIICYKSH